MIRVPQFVEYGTPFIPQYITVCRRTSTDEVDLSMKSLLDAQNVFSCKNEDDSLRE